MSGDAPTLDQARKMVEARAACARDPDRAPQLWQAIGRIRAAPGTTLEPEAPFLSGEADADLLREGHLILALLELADHDFPLEARALEARVAQILAPEGPDPSAA